MPLAKIHVLEGQYDEVRIGRVSSAVQNGPQPRRDRWESSKER